MEEWRVSTLNSYSGRKRHGCLTAWLSLIILASIYRTIIYSTQLVFETVFLEVPTSGNQPLSQSPSWVTIFLIAGAVLTFVFSIALFEWKKWAFWGYSALNIVFFVVYLALGEDVLISLLWLLAIPALYGVFQIGNENKGWTQLVQKTTKEIVRQDQSPHESQSRPNDLESSKKKMEKIRSWPRWIRYGLISAFVSPILAIPWFIDSNLFLFIGPLAPAIFLMILGGPDLGTPIFFIAETALFWFLIGGLIGTFVKSATIAGALWLFILMLTSMVGVLLYAMIMAVGF